jgi:uncharacterized coiled-coil protein SlyX
MSRQSVLKLAAGCVLLVAAGSSGARAQPVFDMQTLLRQQIEALKARGVELEARIADLKSASDHQTKQMVELTDKLNETVSQLHAMRVERDRLAAELAQAKKLLRTHGIPFPPTRKDAAKAREVEGPTTKSGMQGDLVVRARQAEEPRQEKQPPLGMVLKPLEDGRFTITVDDLDGLRVGQKYDVFRSGRSPTRYIGRVSVVEVTAGAVICKSDPKRLLADIQEGDHLVPCESHTPER